MELQQQVRVSLDRKRAHDARESAESHRIAMAHPIKRASPPAAEPVFKRTRTGEWVAVFETTAASAEEQASTHHPAAGEKTVSKKARIIAAAMPAGLKRADLDAGAPLPGHLGAPLPAPLTRAALDAAYLQLPTGASVAIEASINMWREQRLGRAELMSTRG